MIQRGISYHEGTLQSSVRIPEQILLFPSLSRSLIRVQPNICTFGQKERETNTDSGGAPPDDDGLD